MGCLLHWSPKFYNKVFLFVSLKTLGTFKKNFEWSIYKLSVQTFQSLIVFINIGDVHQLDGHCIIPLDT